MHDMWRKWRFLPLVYICGLTLAGLLVAILPPVTRPKSWGLFQPRLALLVAAMLVGICAYLWRPANVVRVVIAFAGSIVLLILGGMASLALIPLPFVMVPLTVAAVGYLLGQLAWQIALRRGCIGQQWIALVASGIFFVLAVVAAITDVLGLTRFYDTAGGLVFIMSFYWGAPVLAASIYTTVVLKHSV